MKVLMFGWEFPPFKTGGLGTACYGLTRGLHSLGVEVTFVIPHSGGAVGSEHVKLIDTTGVHPLQERTEDYTHVRLVRVDVSLAPYARPEHYFQVHRTRHQRKYYVTVETPEDTSKNDELYGEHIFQNIERYIAKAILIARREQFDIIHAHDWMTFQAGIEASKVSGKPLVVHVHATEFDRSGGYNFSSVIRDIEQAGLSAAHRVIAVSNRTRDILVRHYGISPRKISVVYNSIDSDGHPLNRFAKHLLKKKIVLFLGRITVQKGPEYFLEAASRVSKEEPDVVFIMAGSGDMMSKMVERACDLGIGHKVLFPGFVTGAALDMIYNMADVYVMTSVSEPFGIVPLEAMSHGVPTIVSRQSGVSEMVKNVLKTDFWDTDKLANAIIALLRYETLRSSLSRNGESETERLSWRESACQCVSIYRETLGEVPLIKSASPSVAKGPRRPQSHLKLDDVLGNNQLDSSNEHITEVLPSASTESSHHRSIHAPAGHP